MDGAAKNTNAFIIVVGHFSYAMFISLTMAYWPERADGFIMVVHSRMS